MCAYHIVQKSIKVRCKPYDIGHVRSVVEAVEVVIDTGGIRSEQVWNDEITFMRSKYMVQGGRTRL